MEQRSCFRASLKLSMAIDGLGVRGIRCESRDVGMGGMFLEMAKKSLKRGEKVNVIFSLPTERGDHTHCLSARVARIMDDGIGIAFSKPGTATFRTLQELLKFSKNQNLH